MRGASGRDAAPRGHIVSSGQTAGSSPYDPSSRSPTRSPAGPGCARIPHSVSTPIQASVIGGRGFSSGVCVAGAVGPAEDFSV